MNEPGPGVAIIDAELRVDDRDARVFKGLIAATGMSTLIAAWIVNARGTEIPWWRSAARAVGTAVLAMIVLWSGTCSIAR